MKLDQNGPPFRRSNLVAILKEKKSSYIAIFLLLVAQSLLAIVEPWPLQVLFDHVILQKPPGPFLSSVLGASWSAIRPFLLPLMTILLMGVALLNGAALYAHNIRLTLLVQDVVRILRVRLFSHVIDLPLAYFHRVGAGEIVSRITSDTENVQSLVEGGTVLLFRSIPTFLGILLIMLAMDYPFALLTLSLAPLIAWATYACGRKVKEASRAQRRRECEVAAMSELFTRTQKCTKILCLKNREVRRMDQVCSDSRDAAVEASGWQALYTGSTGAVLAAGSALVAFVGVLRIRSGAITPGELLVFMNYLRILMKPVREFTKYQNKIFKALASNERIEDLMGTTSCQLGVCENPKSRPAPPFSSSLVFKHVYFGYEKGRRTLRDIDLEILKGQKVALIGDSGSGKSTIVNLIPRFFDPSSGRVLLDGRDLRLFSLQSIRSQIAIVPQEHIIFQTTVRENIAVGRPEKEATPEEVAYAARQANAHEFIAKLPQGYDTVLGTGEIQLSGGQAKRIHIARAILRNAPIVLLDEPTSGLDPYAERSAMEAFDRLMRRSTIVMVTHHLPLIANADLIVVLRGGVVAEKGTHEELMDQGGIYYAFWQEGLSRLGGRERHRTLNVARKFS